MKPEKVIAILLVLIVAGGLLKFFLHHCLVLSAWVGFGCLIFFTFCIWKWGLDTTYIPGLITGAGLAAACSYALWQHNNIFVMAFVILAWLLATALWYYISPIPR